MERPWIALLVAWVLMWLGVIAIVLPVAAIGTTADRRALAGDWGAAFMWTWLTASIAVPLAAGIGALNWATALVIAIAWPASLWYYRYHGHTRAAIVLLVRRLVLRATSPDRLLTREWFVTQLQIVFSVLPLVVVPMLWSRMEIRLPVPADFDTLSHMQALLENTVTWDPLAALGALLTRVSTVPPLVVLGALRLSLAAVAMLAMATILANELGVARGLAIIAALAAVFVAPAMPAAAWTVLVAALLGTLTLIRWIRSSRARDGWHTVAAAAVLVGQVIPLWSGAAPVLSTSRFVEPRAAALQTLAIARANAGDDWMIVSPPQQRFELSLPQRHYDLATFVERFAAHAGDRQFRFAMPAQRLYLFIELQSGEFAGAAGDAATLAAEPAAYRVPRERQRVQLLARRLCDDYRRTHAGVRIAYDDGELRICEIAV